ncbi:MAG: hypothetical protein PHW31_00910 [Candidatus Pacebacteria bacterium]|nr:hypothetical protein [Candidatus Paceibacterota bacterium]
MVALLVIFLMLVLPFTGTVVFTACACAINPLFWFLALLFLILFLTFLLKGFRFTVQEDARRILEHNGHASRILGSGRYWTIPFVYKQRVELYTSVLTTKLEFSPGKVAFRNVQGTLKGATGYVRLFSPNFTAEDPFLVPYNDDEGRRQHAVYRATYFVGEWDKAVKALLQDTIMSVLQQKNFDAALRIGVPTPVEILNREAAIRLKRWGFYGEITLHIEPSV